MQVFFPRGQVGQSAREMPQAFGGQGKKGGGWWGLPQENLESQVLYERFWAYLSRPQAHYKYFQGPFFKEHFCKFVKIVSLVIVSS